MLKDFNMEHICHQNFYDFFTEHRNNSDDVDLMYKMQAMDRETVRMLALYILCGVTKGWGREYVAMEM